MPDEPGTESRGSAGPLTQRHDEGRTVSDRLRVAQPLPQPQPQSKPQAQPAPSRPRPAAMRSEPLLPGGQTTMDSGLFDRLEHEAQAQRAAMRTMPEISFSTPGGDADVQPHSDHSATSTCPVCGHGFTPNAKHDHHHRCPQCLTAFDDNSGRLSPGDPASNDPLIGRTLRGCLIDRKLGEGGMGSVYRAKQLSLDREVAIKVLPPELARNKNFIQRFEREAKSLARINHVNILHIYDFGEEPELNLYFMVIEYVDGFDLGEIINRRGLLGQVEVLDLLRQSMLGLEQAAEKGVIHRDIKPDNLMVNRDGVIKVSDFGLAKAASAEIGVTAVGVRVGTPAFMSPEQCDGIDVDFRSDIYNLGATAYLAMTGRLPFDGETPFAIMLKHKTEPITSMREIDPSIDREVDRLICRMLAKRPADRAGTLRELIEQIEELEVRLAGTDSIMRKSKGPFRALVNPTQPGHGSGGDVVARRRAAAQIQAGEAVDVVEPADLRLVDERGASSTVHAVYSPELPLPAPPGMTPPPSGKASSARAAAIQSGFPSPVPRPGSRRLDVEIDRARERSRRGELSSVAANGQRLADQGQWTAAAAEWERAVGLSSEPEEQAELRKKAARARGRQRRKQILRAALWTVMPIVCAACAVFAGTPYVHNFVASQELDTIVAQPVDNRQIQARNLRQFAAGHSEPWAWYVQAFQRGYAIPAADRAFALALQVDSVGSLPVPVTATVDISGLERLAADPGTPWMVVLTQAEAMTRAGAGKRASDIQRTAGAALTAAHKDAEQIAVDRQAGRHAQALEKSVAYKTRNPRVPEANLPLPGRIAIDAADNPTPGLVIAVDGQTLAGEGAERLFCRDAQRETLIEVSAVGFLPARIQVPAAGEASERRYIALLRLAPRWTRQLGSALNAPWGMRLEASGTNLVALHHEGLVMFRLSDGTPITQTDRVPGGAGFANLWLAQGDRILTGQDDGTVQLIDPTSFAVDRILFRGRQEPQAWISLDMTYQNGRRIGVVLSDVAGAKQVAAIENGSEIWRYSNLKGGQPGYLARHDDRILAIDDTRVHLIEEDGSGAQPIALPAPRIGPVVPCPALSALLVPTTTGVFALRLGTRQDPLRILADQVLAQAGPGLVTVDREQILIAGIDRELHLLQVGAGGVKELWRHSGDRQFSAPPVLSGELAIVSDERVTIHRRSDGQVIQRIATGAPLAGRPLVVGSGLAVADRAGVVAVYELPKAKP